MVFPKYVTAKLNPLNLYIIFFGDKTDKPLQTVTKLYRSIFD